MNTKFQMLLLVFLSCLSPDLSAQSYTLEMDSMSRKYIGLLSPQRQIKFRKLIAQRTGNDFFRRVDTIAFDYAFIDETYCFSENEGKITERYFHVHDSFPFRMFVNNKSIFVNEHYNNSTSDFHFENYILPFTFPLLTDTWSRFQHVQELHYNKRQIMNTGCVVQEGAEKKFRKETTQRLESTYRITTLIDKVSHKIIVSVQFAPQNPQFRVIHYNAVWDF